MTAWQWVAIALTWLGLVIVLLVVGDGSPVNGCAAAFGVVLLFANGRRIERRKPTPLFDGNPSTAELALGVSLIAVSIFGAMEWKFWFLASVVISAGVGGYLLLRRPLY